MATFHQMVGARKSGRAAADHGDFLAGLIAGRREFEVIGDGVLAQKMFDRIDADKILNLVAITAGFARCRTDAPHDGRKRICVGDAPECVLLPGHARRRFFDAAHDIKVAANIFARWATPLAGRRALNVGRALVRVIGVKNLRLPIDGLIVSVFIAAESQCLGLCGFHYVCHRDYPLVN